MVEVPDSPMETREGTQGEMDLATTQNQLGGVQDLPDMPSAAVRVRIHRMKNLALAFLSQFDNLGSFEPININRGIDLKDEVRRFEVELIRSALDHTGGNQRRAARLLGLKPTTLNAKMKLYGILDSSDAALDGGG